MFDSRACSTRGSLTILRKRWHSSLLLKMAKHKYLSMISVIIITGKVSGGGKCPTAFACNDPSENISTIWGQSDYYNNNNKILTWGKTRFGPQAPNLVFKRETYNDHKPNRWHHSNWALLIGGPRGNGGPHSQRFHRSVRSMFTSFVVCASDHK